MSEAKAMFALSAAEGAEPHLKQVIEMLAGMNSSEKSERSNDATNCTRMISTSQSDLAVS